MAKKIYKKGNTEETVIELAQERIEKLFARFDKVQVFFSGGKDSTVCLMLTYEIAKRLNRLPLDVVFIDEEAIHPPTIEYVERVRNMPGVNMMWFCLPVKHRNACSITEPYWYTWDETRKDLWIRPLPDHAITSHPKFKKGMTIPEFAPHIHNAKDGMCVQILGLRSQESIRRYRVVAMKKHDNYITNMDGRTNCFRAFPIYDWVTDDVWVAPGKYGWDYNKTYDIFEQAGMPQNKQRVCPPYGEEPLRGLWIYAECFPEMWHKMLYRVKGCATAWRYANTEIYSVGKVLKPDNIPTWKAYLTTVLDMYSPDTKAEITDSINRLIRIHHEKSILPIQDDVADYLSGCSWQFLCKIAVRGDLKGRVAQNMLNNGMVLVEQMGLSYTEAVQKWGTEKEKQKITFKNKRFKQAT